jgi:hypothetical protein
MTDSGVNVRRTIERKARWSWWGTIAYQGKPDVADSVPPFTLEIHGYHGCGPTRKATTLRRLTRKLDEAEGALHRTQRERSISGVTEP